MDKKKKASVMNSKKTEAMGKKAETSSKKAETAGKKKPTDKASVKKAEKALKIPQAETKVETKVENKSLSDADKSLIMKEAILARYRSIRSFAIEMEIPYSTIVTALDRGIEGMAYGTVIRICDKLKMNPVDFTYLDDSMAVSEQLLKNRVMSYYVKLNRTGQDRILELMDDFASIDKYQA